VRRLSPVQQVWVCGQKVIDKGVKLGQLSTILDSGVVPPGRRKSSGMPPYSTAASLVRLSSCNSRLGFNKLVFGWRDRIVMTRRELVKRGMIYAGVTSFANSAQVAASPVRVDTQPFCAHTRRLIEAMNFLGAPFREQDLQALSSLLRQSYSSTTVADIQKFSRRTFY
jgi:hypothetical protein